jgi:DNA-binding transcriptional ArsR family regulator
MPISAYIAAVARSSTTSDVFNAIAESDRRAILPVLAAGEKAVGAIVDDLSMSQPQVSKHLRVLSQVGLVSSRADGRRRLYRVETARLRPMHDWLSSVEQAFNARLDRVDAYLQELQKKEKTDDI